MSSSSAPVGTTLEQAEQILQEHKIEKLPVVDESRLLKGLITFKERWGAVSSPLSYLSVSCRSRPRTRRAWRLPVPRPLLACVPDRAFTAAGAFLYRHIG